MSGMFAVSRCPRCFQVQPVLESRCRRCGNVHYGRPCRVVTGVFVTVVMMGMLAMASYAMH